MTDTNTLAPTDAPDLLQIARSTGLRSHLQGVSATDARELLKAFVDALPRAPASQPVAVPAGMRITYIQPTGVMGIAPFGPGTSVVRPEPPKPVAVPAAWAATSEEGNVEALGMNQSRRFDTPLFTAAQVQAMLAAAPSGPAREPMTDEMVLAAARVMSPQLFKHGLEPLPGDGPVTSKRMESEAAQVRKMLHAAHGITAAQNGGQRGTD